MCRPGADPGSHIHTCARAYAHPHSGTHGNADTGPDCHT